MSQPVSVIYDVEITGIAPMLQNNVGGSEGVGNVPRNPKRGVAGIKDNPDEWERKVYRSNGHLGHPGAAIESALIKAARDFKADKRRTMVEMVKASMFVNEQFIDLGVKKPDCVNRASAVNPNTKGRGFIYRPQFNAGWKGKFSLTVRNSDIIPVERIKEILEHAGRMVGIGDWRPKFGRFIVTEFKARK